jgi:hypothetical protein
VSETYAAGGRQDQARVGGILIAAISILSAVLLIAALVYAAGTGGRHKAALAAAGCEPNLSPSGLPCTTVQMLTHRYRLIAAPALQQLATDVSAYAAKDRRNLTAARAALTAEVTVENALGASLARFPFPPAAIPRARALIVANQTSSRLAAQQARSSSLAELRSFNEQARAARAAVRVEINLVGRTLNVPPTASQEP